MNYSPNSFSDAVKKSIDLLLTWVEKNGWAGFDPYDVYGIPLLVRLNNRNRHRTLVEKVIMHVLSKCIENWPKKARDLLGIKREINAKAMGLFLQAYARLFIKTGIQAYRIRAIECATWLLNNVGKEYPGKSWGYPFDWQSIVFIPRGTPSAVVSVTVGNGFWYLWKATNDNKYLKICEDICIFLVHGLKKTDKGNGAICFSYTPIDGFLVHNANLMAAEFLARCGSVIGNMNYIDLGIRAGLYALNEQNENGSIYYWGKEQDKNAQKHLDCYHSGFEIRALWGLWKATSDNRFHDAAIKYASFFFKSYSGSDGAIYTSPQVLYPIDIHACAEMLICTAETADIDEKRAKDILYKTFLWINKYMQNKDGSYAYKRKNKNKIERFAFIRWGQAWMLCALSVLFSYIVD